MATRIYGISRGETDFQVTEGVGSATTDGMEFTFDLAANLTRAEILQGLDIIKRHILSGTFPPA